MGNFIVCIMGCNLGCTHDRLAIIRIICYSAALIMYAIMYGIMCAATAHDGLLFE